MSGNQRFSIPGTNITVINCNPAAVFYPQLHELEVVVQPGNADLFRALWSDERIKSQRRVDGSPIPGNTPDEKREYFRANIIPAAIAALRRMIALPTPFF